MGLKMCLLIALVVVTVLTHESIAEQSPCNQPFEVGPCRGRIPRYGYNPKSGRCEQFIYGGCQGNENNFRNLEECKKTCENH